MLLHQAFRVTVAFLSIRGGLGKDRQAFRFANEYALGKNP